MSRADDFKTLGQEMMAGLKGRRQFCQELHRDTAQMMQGLHKENQERARDTAQMLRGFHQEHQQRAREIKKELADFQAARMKEAEADLKARKGYVNELFGETRHMMGEFAGESKMARAAARSALAAVEAVRFGKPMEAPAPKAARRRRRKQ